jgi:hypothetical protein
MKFQPSVNVMDSLPTEFAVLGQRFLVNDPENGEFTK